MPELQYIEVEKLHPHPDNPRKEIGDVSELAESIKQNGIFQNLTVVPNMVTGEVTGEVWQRGYTVIIGHRRLAAAKVAGLEKVPCVVADMTPKEQLQTMLLENMQRSDLTVYEQAQGFQLKLDDLYNWLCALGYEMSDEEKAMQDGSHEVFKEAASP